MVPAQISSTLIDFINTLLELLGGTPLADQMSYMKSKQYWFVKLIVHKLLCS